LILENSPTFSWVKKERNHEQNTFVIQAFIAPQPGGQSPYVIPAEAGIH
jgi:hypothetical protein